MPSAAASLVRRLPMPPSSLVVPAIAAAGGAGFLLWKPGVAVAMARSPQAAGFTILIGAAVLGIGWLLPRLGLGARTTAAVQLVPVLVAFVLTVAPAFHNVTVNEAFPAAGSAEAESAASDVPAPAGEPVATVVSRGRLRGIDHDATGDALLVRRADGTFVVRLENLDVEPGPDYQVHLVPGAEQGHPDGGVHLGRLRGNRGNQNYDVPPRVEVTTPVTLLIWCRVFAVPIAAATLG